MTEEIDIRRSLEAIEAAKRDADEMKHALSQLRTLESRIESISVGYYLKGQRTLVLGGWMGQVNGNGADWHVSADGETALLVMTFVRKQLVDDINRLKALVKASVELL